MGIRIENIFISDEGLLKLFYFSDSFRINELNENIWHRIQN